MHRRGRCVTIRMTMKFLLENYFHKTQAVNVFGGEQGSYNSSTNVTSTPEYGSKFLYLLNQQQVQT